jgi:hypothetical protein
MNAHKTSLVYTCPDHIRWVKESTGIIVVDEQTQQAHHLAGAETAVWDWLMLGYAYSRMVRLTAVLLDIPFPQAKQHLHRQLQTWQRRGLLALQGEADG